MTWKREPLTEDEAEELFEAAKGFDLIHEFTVRLITHSGLRADEFAHLTSDWMEWQDNAVRVPRHEDCDCANCHRKAKARADNSDRTWDAIVDDMWMPKTPESSRMVPIGDPDTLRVTRQFFERNEGVEVNRQAVHGRVKRVAKETDIKKKVRPHSLRHTYGTLIALNGASPQYIKQTMGHSDISHATDYIEYTGRQIQAEADDVWGGGSV